MAETKNKTKIEMPETVVIETAEDLIKAYPELTTVIIDAGKIETVLDLRAAYPELIAEIIADETVQIVTAQDLQKAYPELVQQITEDELKDFVNGMTAREVSETMPELYERIVRDIRAGSGPNLNVKGFLLNIADPYAAGTLRAYQGLKKAEGLKLPYVLPYKDRHTKAAIESYILRAEGGGDFERAGAARKALAKVK